MPKIADRAGMAGVRPSRDSKAKPCLVLRQYRRIHSLLDIAEDLCANLRSDTAPLPEQDHVLLLLTLEYLAWARFGRELENIPNGNEVTSLSAALNELDAQLQALQSEPAWMTKTLAKNNRLLLMIEEYCRKWRQVLDLERIAESATSSSFTPRFPGADRVDPLFDEPVQESYRPLFFYLTQRVVRIGVSGSTLSLLRQAAISAERLETLSSAFSEGFEILQARSRALLGVQRETVSALAKVNGVSSATSRMLNWADDSLAVARDGLSELSRLSRRAGMSLVRPRAARRDQRPDSPPEAAVRGRKHRLPQSWQSQVLSLPLRLWLKRQMKSGDHETWRRRLGYARWFTSAPPRGTSIENLCIGSVKVERIVARDTTGTRVLLYLPGGGFIFPATPMHRTLVVRLARALDASAWLVHYRLAPEHPFPAALDDCLAVYRHMLATGIDPRRIVFAGDSAGAGLLLSLLFALRDAGEPLPAVAVPISPLADLTYSGGSRVYNRLRDPILPTRRGVELNEVYLNGTPAASPLVSPIYGDFTNLPPMLVQVGSTEILLDDSLRVASAARAQAVPVQVEVWREMPHVWHLLSMLPESAQALQHISEFVRLNIPDAMAVTSAEPYPE